MGSVGLRRGSWTGRRFEVEPPFLSIERGERCLAHEPPSSIEFEPQLGASWAVRPSLNIRSIHALPRAKGDFDNSDQCKQVGAWTPWLNHRRVATWDC